MGPTTPACAFQNIPLISRVLVTYNSSFHMCSAQVQDLKPAKTDAEILAHMRINPKEIYPALEVLRK